MRATTPAGWALAGGAAAVVVAAVSVPVLVVGEKPAGPPQAALTAAAAVLQSRLRAASMGELDADLPVVDQVPFDADVRALSAWGRDRGLVGTVGAATVVLEWQQQSSVGGTLTVTGVEHDRLAFGTIVNGGDGVGEVTTLDGRVAASSVPVTVVLVLRGDRWLVEHVAPQQSGELTAQGGF